MNPQTYLKLQKMDQWNGIRHLTFGVVQASVPSWNGTMSLVAMMDLAISLMRILHG